MENKELQKIANNLRKNIIKMVANDKSGQIVGS